LALEISPSSSAQIKLNALLEMKLKDFVKEHKRLIKILNKGTKAQQRKEAKDQAAELLRMLKKPTLK